MTAPAVRRGRADLAAFHDEPLDAPDVLALAAKTLCVDDPQSDYPAHFPGEVIVHLKDGRQLRSRKPASLGTREVPLSREGVTAKFLANATRVVTHEQAQRLAAAVLQLEQAASLQQVVALSTVGKQGARRS